MNPYLDASGEISIISKPECFRHFGVQVPLLTTPPPFGGGIPNCMKASTSMLKGCTDKTCHMWIHVPLGHLGGRIGLAPGGRKAWRACYTNKSKTHVENESDRERERDTYLETLSPLQKPHLNACIDSFKICTTAQILLYDMDIYPKQKSPLHYLWDVPSVRRTYEEGWCTMSKHLWIYDVCQYDIIVIIFSGVDDNDTGGQKQSNTWNVSTYSTSSISIIRDEFCADNSELWLIAASPLTSD